jgi:hypothetical protein
MADTSHPTLVYMDDILGSDGLSSIEHEDGWPSMGIRFMPGTNASHYLQVLEEHASKSNGAFEVFTHENMPERWHFSGNERIAPIYVVPKLGYALTTKAEGDTGMSKGNHGYDNTNPSMHGNFDLLHSCFLFSKMIFSNVCRSRTIFICRENFTPPERSLLAYAAEQRMALNSGRYLCDGELPEREHL